MPLTGSAPREPSAAACVNHRTAAACVNRLLPGAAAGRTAAPYFAGSVIATILSTTNSLYPRHGTDPIYSL